MTNEFNICLLKFSGASSGLKPDKISDTGFRCLGNEFALKTIDKCLINCILQLYLHIKDKQKLKDLKKICLIFNEASIFNSL